MMRRNRLFSFVEAPTIEAVTELAALKEACYPNLRRVGGIQQKIDHGPGGTVKYRQKFKKT